MSNSVYETARSRNASQSKPCNICYCSLFALLVLSGFLYILSINLLSRLWVFGSPVTLCRVSNCRTVFCKTCWTESCTNSLETFCVKVGNAALSTLTSYTRWLSKSRSSDTPSTADIWAANRKWLVTSRNPSSREGSEKLSKCCRYLKGEKWNMGRVKALAWYNPEIEIFKCAIRIELFNRVTNWQDLAKI